jgi:mannose-6-phosphate isomerase-like protein (cupin superfamily)
VPKHLVLDDDVHRSLRKKKRETGVNVQDIGNALLRSVLERPVVAQLIGKKLVESGKLTEEEFDRLLNASTREASAVVSDVASLVRTTKRSTVAVGSWELQELYVSEDDSFQILKAWSKDRRSKPFPAHRHESEAIFVVLSGKLLVTLSDEAVVLSAADAHHVPSGEPHAITPIERDTLVLVIVFPPEHSYRAVAQ